MRSCGVMTTSSSTTTPTQFSCAWTLYGPPMLCFASIFDLVRLFSSLAWLELSGMSRDRGETGSYGVPSVDSCLSGTYMRGQHVSMALRTGSGGLGASLSFSC